MIVLRCGKKLCYQSIDTKRKRTKKLRKEIKKYNIRDVSVNLKRLSPEEINILIRPKILCSTNKISNAPITVNRCVEKKITLPVKKIALANIIWKQLTSNIYDFMPTEIVLAKMNTFRPWPARINSIYQVGDITKCYVMFFGTYQIGSVSKRECVKISDCSTYICHAVKEIKQKFKWMLDYEQLTSTNEEDRILALAKLTQAQKFLLSIRDMERIQNIPYDLSVILNA